jgi:hypothetical protein
MKAGSKVTPGWYRDDKEDEDVPEGVFAVPRATCRSSFMVGLVNWMGQRGWLRKIVELIARDFAV